MFKVKKKDTRAMTINFVFVSVDVSLVSFFVNFGHILHRFLVFLLLTSNRQILTGNKIVWLKVSTEL